MKKEGGSGKTGKEGKKERKVWQRKKKAANLVSSQSISLCLISLACGYITNYIFKASTVMCIYHTWVLSKGWSWF